MDGLGRLFDIGLAWSPVDSQTGAITGKRICMEMGRACTIVVNKAAGTANDDPVFTLSQHTAYTGGTTSNLVAISYVFVKEETALDNDESWAKVTQAAAATFTGDGTSAKSQVLYVFEVNASQLTTGYTHISLNLADTGSAGAQLCSAVYLLHELRYQRKPVNLSNLLNPGAANA